MALEEFHSLLKRQLKNLPEDSRKGPEIAKFLELVNRAYHDFDADRKILERSTELSSQELSVLNERLAKQTKQLASSNQELEQFAYIASHDLQEPLRMVASYTALLQQRYKDKLDEDAQEFIHFAVDGANRMRALIDDLLTYSRVTTKAKAMESVDMKSIFDIVIANLKIALMERNAMVARSDLPVISADPVAMVQIFQNLIGNATKFRKKDSSPTVYVACEPKDKSWLFSVKDNGIGIAAANFDRVFAIFQRLHSREEYEGTGIGLAVCKKIVERHGGHIWLESEVGKGSTFFFTIPMIGGKHAGTS